MADIRWLVVAPADRPGLANRSCISFIATDAGPTLSRPPGRAGRPTATPRLGGWHGRRIAAGGLGPAKRRGATAIANKAQVSVYTPSSIQFSSTSMIAPKLSSPSAPIQPPQPCTCAPVPQPIAALTSVIFTLSCLHPDGSAQTK